MFRFTRAAVNVSSQALQQVRHKHIRRDMHYKYGNQVLVGGIVFCVGIWTYVATSTGIAWNLSPVGRVMPKPWRTEEEEE